MAAISSHKMSSLVRRSGYQLVLIIVAEWTTKATSRRDYFNAWVELSSFMAGNEGGSGMLQWFIMSWQSRKQKWSMKQG